jgi:DNA replication protein DnaC
MTQIGPALKAVLDRVYNPPAPPPMVNDDAVAKKLDQMFEAGGYRPSEQVVEPVRAYLSGYGILLSGDAGIGKTMLMQCLGARLYHVERITAYGLNNVDAFYSWTDRGAICIDDLGAERTLTEYGNRDDLLKHVIDHRARGTFIDEHATMQTIGRTSVTTNLSGKQIRDRYGDRTLSRIMGMCKCFTMTGKNLRTARVLESDFAGMEVGQ